MKGPSSLPNFHIMADPRSNKPAGTQKTSQKLSPETYARLKGEAAAPYRGLRKFVYVVCGASGFLGAFVFLAQLIAGREVGSALPNFALQVGVIALMIWLFRLDKASGKQR